MYKHLLDHFLQEFVLVLTHRLTANSITMICLVLAIVIGSCVTDRIQFNLSSASSLSVKQMERDCFILGSDSKLDYILYMYVLDVICPYFNSQIDCYDYEMLRLVLGIISDSCLDVTDQTHSTEVVCINSLCLHFRLLFMKAF